MINTIKTDIKEMVTLSREHNPSTTPSVYGLLMNTIYPGTIQDWVKAGLGKEEIERKVAHYKRHFCNGLFDLDYIVERDGDKLVGFLIMTNPKVGHPTGNKKGGEIEILLVAPEYRGKGIGTKMMNEAIEIFNKKGRDEFKVSSEWKAVGFYQKFGFKEESGKPRLFRAIERLTTPFLEMYRIPEMETGEVFC